MKYLLLLFTLINFAQSQKFIPLDEDTLEFIDEVNFTLYSNKNPVFSSITSKDSVTRLPNNVVFDSIAFKKSNYIDTGLKKENLTEVVTIKKMTYELNEVIISNTKPKEMVIGEKSRFVKRYSRKLTSNPDYGILFRDYELKNKSVKRLNFFVEKVKFKTSYKIKFYAAQEVGNPITFQTLELNELLFESPVLTLEAGTKNKVEVNLEAYNMDLVDENVFVCIELLSYYDENNNPIQPELKENTELKFQISGVTNYYSKTFDIEKQELSEDIININVMINRDFAFQFFKKPHKSILVTPAIILYATKIN